MTTVLPASRPLLLPLLYRWHRRIGLIAALGVLLWATSGLSHPIMTRLFPSPVEMRPPMAQAHPHGASLADTLRAQGIAQVQEARLIAWQGQTWWQVRLPNQSERAYIDTTTGATRPQGDRDYAIMLARHFSGEKVADVKAATLVTAFDDDYHPVNRLLPVWRIAFDRPDGLRAYVETGPARLATLSNDRKALFQGIFGALHTWRWLDDAPRLKQVLMSTLLLAASGAALFGMILWVKRPKRAGGAAGRVWHRRLGLLALGSTFAFTLSGLFHVWVSKGFPAPVQAANLLAIASATLPPDQLKTGATLLDLNGQLYWRIGAPAAAPGKTGGEHAGHGGHGSHSPSGAKGAAYVNAANGTPLENGDQMLARELAPKLSGLPASAISTITPVNAFMPEYGFINKRLPVQRVGFDLPGKPAVFIEPATGTLASTVVQTDRIEGFSFAYLHKATWLDGIGKGPRDTVLGLFALLNAVLVVLGLRLWWQRRGR